MSFDTSKQPNLQNLPRIQTSLPLQTRTRGRIPLAEVSQIPSQATFGSIKEMGYWVDERLDRLVFGVVAEGYGDLGLERGVVWSCRVF